jgi:preprotein translocase subunit YajC
MTFLYGLIAAHPGVAAAAATSPSKSTTQTSGFGAWGLWVILGLMFIVMYFVLYRPQRKRAQEAQNVLSTLQKGDEVVTIGGIHGVIKRLTEDTVVVEVDKGVRMTFSRSAISRTLTVHEPEVEEEEEVAAEPEEYDETGEAFEDEGEEAEPEAEDTSGGDGEKGKK